MKSEGRDLVLESATQLVFACRSIQPLEYWREGCLLQHISIVFERLRHLSGVINQSINQSGNLDLGYRQLGKSPHTWGDNAALLIMVPSNKFLAVLMIFRLLSFERAQNSQSLMSRRLDHSAFVAFLDSVTGFFLQRLRFDVGFSPWNRRSDYVVQIFPSDRATAVYFSNRPEQ